VYKYAEFGCISLWQGIPGVAYDRQGGYYSITGGCDSLSSLPDIAFVIDGKTYSMPPVQWTQSVRAVHLLMAACLSHAPSSPAQQLSHASTAGRQGASADELHVKAAEILNLGGFARSKQGLQQC
jgi:hypothetical protein